VRPARRFPEILGHAGTLEALGKALDEERLSPALLFHGPAGVGKLTAGVELARCLLCEISAPFPCGRCESCRKISASALLHPDVGILFPRKKEEGPDKASEPSHGHAPDLHAIQDEARRNLAWRILVEPTRERLSQLFLSPSRGRRRILLILGSERLQEESGNALLKVLEEPPPPALLLLLCENSQALLPTLRSRCQQYRFGTLPRGTIAEFLERHASTGPDLARRVASLSGGRPGEALEMLDRVEAYAQRGAQLARLLAEARRLGTAAAALAAAAEITSDESRTHEDLAILGDLLRDAMLARLGCDSSLLTLSREDPMAPLFTPWEAASLLPRLERAREDLRRFVNRTLAVESLFLDLVKGPSDAVPSDSPASPLPTVTG
jgi:DNA polymerase-3 subunit delta'